MELAKQSHAVLVIYMCVIGLDEIRERYCRPEDSFRNNKQYLIVIQRIIVPKEF